MKVIFIILLFFTQYSLAQIIVYEGFKSFGQTFPSSNDINKAAILSMLPEKIYEKRIVIINNKKGYSLTVPSQHQPTVDKEGHFTWINYKENTYYSQKMGVQNSVCLEIVASSETKKICGYDCKMYYHLYEFKGEKDTCFFWISPELPDKVSAQALFCNTQNAKGTVLAEKTNLNYWEAISVTPCRKINKKLFNQALHPQNVSLDKLKKYVPCSF